MKEYGLIGYPLTHSFSAGYFADKFAREGINDCVYRNFPIENVGLIKELINSHPDLRGLNVTIPYKEKVIPLLDSFDDESARIGAVNTIKICRKNAACILKGFNTDAYGFETSIKPFLKADNKIALVLGTGGASKAVEYVLRKLGIAVIFVSRTPSNPGHIGYHDVSPSILKKASILVNTSPVGMYPNTNDCPDLPYDCLTADHLLYDLIYNPPETQFMALGQSRGATTINGLQMLHLQAEKAWEIWNSGNC